MAVIRQESPGYGTLLLRKSGKVKMGETLIFIVILILLYAFLGYNHPYFKLGAVLIAIASLGLSPILYKGLVKPIYTLTETELVIQKRNKEERIPIVNIKPSYDLRFIFVINGEKRVLSVSDAFLEELNKRIELLNQKKNSRR